MNVMGWRHALLLVGFVGLLLALIFILFIREAPAHHFSHEQFKFKQVFDALRNKQNWLLTCYTGLAFSPVTIFGTLWGNRFLVEAYQLSNTDIAFWISFIFVGLGLGSPILGLLSNYFKERRFAMVLNTFVGFISLSIVIYIHPLPIWLLGSLLFLFGFSIGGFMLAFSVGKEINPHFLTGTVIAMINTSEPILNGITEPLIGKILDLRWQGTIIHGIRFYSVNDYIIALSILPIYLLIATLLLFFLEDHPISS